MNLGLILSAVLSAAAQNPGATTSTVKGFIDLFKATTAPTPVATTPTGSDVPIKRGPSIAVQQLQQLLNQFMDANLVADGWMGPKTEAAIMAAVTKLQPYLHMLTGR